MQSSYSRQYRDLWSNHWWWQSRHHLVMTHVHECIAGASPEKTSILDVGCAGGVSFPDLMKLGEVYGIEPDADLIDDSDPWVDRIDQVVFDSNYQPGRHYRLITMLDVLEHIEDDKAALLHLFDLLEPSGNLIVTVPALPSLWSHHDVINRHFRRYRRRQLRELLLETGFTDLNIRYFMGWSLPLMYLRRVLNPASLDSAPPTDEVRVPPALVNSLFRSITRVEEALVRATRVTSPLGSSLLAVVSKLE